MMYDNDKNNDKNNNNNEGTTKVCKRPTYLCHHQRKRTPL